MKEEYPDAKQDLYGAFVVRGTDLAHDTGLLAIVVGDTWMSIKSFEALRLRLLNGHAFDSFVHMRDVSNHPDIFGANAAFVLSMAGNRSRHAPFIRLTRLGSDRKEQDLRVALAQRTGNTGFHLASGADFAAIPGSPIVYWLSEKMRAAFVRAGYGDALGDTYGVAQGITTGDNGRFLRLWWEVSHCESEFSRDQNATTPTRAWQASDKGGDFRRWYGNNEWVIFWPDDGHEVISFAGSTPRNIHTRFRPSIACTKISSGGISFRAHDRGFIFTDAAVAVTGDGDFDSVLGFVNSSTANHMMAALAPTLNFEVGQIRSLPWLIDRVFGRVLSPIVAQLVSNSTDDWDSAETSWNFQCNPLARRGAVDSAD